MRLLIALSTLATLLHFADGRPFEGSNVLMRLLETGGGKRVSKSTCSHVPDDAVLDTAVHMLQ